MQPQNKPELTGTQFFNIEQRGVKRPRLQPERERVYGAQGQCFDKTLEVTFFPHDEKFGRACYDVEYSIIADTAEEAQEILREIDNIY